MTYSFDNMSWELATLTEDGGHYSWEVASAWTNVKEALPWLQVQTFKGL